MTGLLVSVRDAAEAELAIQNGASIIDVKDPSQGSLGAASASAWQAVHEVCPSDTPVSVAMGELLQKPLAARLAALPPVCFAKFGLAGCGQQGDWESRWAWAIKQLPAPTQAVAVIYVDAARRAPDPTHILALANQFACAAVLWDTFDKQHGNLFCHISPEELAQQVAFARQANLKVVLAGSLTQSELPAVEQFVPDFVAVRGAVCYPNRSGMLRGTRVRQLATFVANWPSPNRVPSP